MEEKWKCTHTCSKPKKYFLEGDKIYVSNFGRVKLNDDILELGKGLTIDAHGNIYIVKLAWPNKMSFHRLIYSIFNGELKNGKQYNIHHIDYNHLNNRADNLIQLTIKEHGDVHSGDSLDREKWVALMTVKEKIKELYNNHDNYVQSSIEYYEQRLKPYKEEIERKRQERLQKREENKIRKEENKKRQQELVASGECYINKDGRLCHTTTKKKGQKCSTETKTKISNTIKNLYKTSPEYLKTARQKLLKGRIRMKNENIHYKVKIKDIETGIIYASLKECCETVNKSSCYVRKHSERFIKC